MGGNTYQLLARLLQIWMLTSVALKKRVLLYLALHNSGRHWYSEATVALLVWILKTVMLILAVSIFFSNDMRWAVLAHIHQVFLTLTKQLLLLFLKRYIVFSQFFILLAVCSYSILSWMLLHLVLEAAGITGWSIDRAVKCVVDAGIATCILGCWYGGKEARGPRICR